MSFERPSTSVQRLGSAHHLVAEKPPFVMRLHSHFQVAHGLASTSMDGPR